jgi:integrase
MPSGKKLRAGTLEQYNCVYLLVEEFQQLLQSPLRIQLLNKSSLRLIQKEKLYWSRFFKNFTAFLYKQKKCFDQYVGLVCKVLKTFFNYLLKDKCLPVGEFHRQFRVPTEHCNPVVISPEQLKFLITNTAFEASLPQHLQRTKDLFVFGCTIGLRFQDLMRLKKQHLQFSDAGAYIVLHTQKTSTEVKIPLPDYAISIYHKYKRTTGNYILPQLSGTNFNEQIKEIIKRAGWTYNLPKIKQKQGEQVEIKTQANETYKFYHHITAHTMRRTAITTLLLLGVNENAVRKISGHAAGSKEFYRYVVLVQDYLNAQVKNAHLKLISNEENLIQKVA